jgi:L-threonate 2-dehydrogenase
VAGLISAVSPMGKYVGEFGTGTKLKYIANTLAFTHVTVAAEAMAFAELMGLDLPTVAEILSGSGGASSGQFSIRAPMMASGTFPNTFVTVDMTIKDLDQIRAKAGDVGASVPLLTAVAEQFGEFAAAGEGDSEPGKLFLHYLSKASSDDAEPSLASAEGGRGKSSSL